MKTILAIIGAVAVYCWALGTLDIIDFKFCISPAGTCSIEVRK
jgi:hypothetical protein